MSLFMHFVAEDTMGHEGLASSWAVLRSHKDKCAELDERNAIVQEWGRQSIVWDNELNDGNATLSGAWRSFYTITREQFSPKRAAINPILPNTTFHLYYDLPMDYTCDNVGNEGQRLQSCVKVKELMDYMLSKQDDTRSPDLYIVPMDYLAVQVTRGSTNFRNILTVIEKVTKGLRYLRFGGSNHIFLCLTDGCRVIMQEIIDRYEIPHCAEPGSLLMLLSMILCSLLSTPE